MHLNVQHLQEFEIYHRLEWNIVYTIRYKFITYYIFMTPLLRIMLYIVIY